jgi:hypothetical protein
MVVGDLWKDRSWGIMYDRALPFLFFYYLVHDTSVIQHFLLIPGKDIIYLYFIKALALLLVIIVGEH